MMSDSSSTAPIEDRHLVVVDVETTGLRDVDIPVEVAWWDMTTGQRGCYVPRHDVAWALTYGDPVALKLNGYRERLADAQQDSTGEGRDALIEALRGNTWGGANPGFDVRYLGLPEQVWHYRLADLEAYAGGRWGYPPFRLPSAAQVCERLGVVNHAPHTAQGDVDAEGRCFDALGWKRLAELAP